MKRNIRIARQLLKIAKELVSFNEQVTDSEIQFIRNEFKKDLQDEKNMDNRRAKAMKQFPLDEKTLKKCLDTYDELMKKTIENSSMGCLYPVNLADRFVEAYGKDCPVQCHDIFKKILNDESKVLGLKESH